jgi:hypothetical protein
VLAVTTMCVCASLLFVASTLFELRGARRVRINGVACGRLPILEAVLLWRGYGRCATTHRDQSEGAGPSRVLGKTVPST